MKMVPIKFKGYNQEIAKNQDEYLTLPAFVDENGLVVSCWKLTWWERIVVFFRGTFWFSQHTFGEKVQPQRPSLKCPLIYGETK